MPAIVRHATWQHGIRFRERITDWQPGRALSWRFIFDHFAGWAYTDRHLLPDTDHFRVETGGYVVEPVAAGVSRLTLHTTYRVRTPVSAYARLWGELFLGDLESNLLTILKERAEREAVLQTGSMTDARP
jgi:hypothetical protein